MEEVRFAHRSSPSSDSRSSRHTVRNEQRGWDGASPMASNSHSPASTSDPNAWFSTPADHGVPNPPTSTREPHARNNGTWGADESNPASSGGVQPRSGPKRPGFWKADGRWDSEAAARAHGPADPSSGYSAEPSRPAGKRREFFAEPSHPVGQKNEFSTEWSRPIGQKNESSSEWSRPIGQMNESSSEWSRPIGQKNESSTEWSRPIEQKNESSSEWSRPIDQERDRPTEAESVQKNEFSTEWSRPIDQEKDRPTEAESVPPSKQVKSIFPKIAGEKSLSESRWAVAGDTSGYDFGMRNRARGGYRNRGSSARHTNQWDTQTSSKGRSQTQGVNGNGWEGERSNGEGGDPSWDASDGWSSIPQKVNTQQPRQQWDSQTPSKGRSQSQGSDGQGWGVEENIAEENKQSWDNSDAWSAKPQNANSRHLKQQGDAQGQTSKSQEQSQGPNRRGDGNGWGGEHDNGGGEDHSWDNSDTWSSKPQERDSRHPRQQWNDQQWDERQPDQQGRGNAQGHGRGGEDNGWGGERTNGVGEDQGWDNTDSWTTKPEEVNSRQPRQQWHNQQSDTQARGNAQGHGQEGENNGWAGGWNSGKGEDQSWDRGEARSSTGDSRQPKGRWDKQDPSDSRDQSQKSGEIGWGGGWNSGIGEDHSWDRGAGSSNTPNQPWNQGQNQEGQGWNDDRWRGAREDEGRVRMEARSSKPLRGDSRQPNQQWKSQDQAQGLEGDDIGWGEREDPSSSSGKAEWSNPRKERSSQRPNPQAQTRSQNWGQEGENVGWEGGWNNRGREDRDWDTGETKSSRPPKGASDQSWDRVEAKSSKSPREDSLQQSQRWDTHGLNQSQRDGDTGWGRGWNSGGGEDRISNRGEAKWSNPSKEDSRQQWNNAPGQNQGHHQTQSGGNEWNNDEEDRGWDNDEAPARKRGW
ncbi:hypothetical protein MMC07_008646 [Pseudocyphellaria aurata]|nr:hypothetical protein [Pseudocyphellaria aurata]